MYEKERDCLIALATLTAGCVVAVVVLVLEGSQAELAVIGGLLLGLGASGVLGSLRAVIGEAAETDVVEESGE